MLSVGLNLSSNRVYIIELLKSGKNHAIRKMIRSDLPGGCTERGEIQDTDILAGSLKDIWRKYRISDRKVFIGISNQKVIAKEIKIPVTDDTEIDNSIKFQINDFIPIAKNNIVYDYYIVEKGEDYSRLMLVGAMKSMINDVAKSFKGAGLLAQAIDLNCFSLYRIVDYIGSFEKKTRSEIPGAYCVVNLGLEMSILEMIQDDNLKYPRFTSTSIRNFIESISKEIKKDNKYYEKIISKFDFKSLLVNKKTGTGKVKEEDQKSKKDNNRNSEDNLDMTKIMKDNADKIIEEIKLSVEYFLQENPKYKVKKVILTGEYIKNIDKYIEQEINYKVEMLNIADYFSLKYLKNNPEYKDKDLNYLLDPLAIGMALRGLNK
ncbi:MAG: pilus assembly protein PilM [Actinomycetota bacterium]|nr:pilus assembly protein PilM [Actinomycetota bacterium]